MSPRCWHAAGDQIAYAAFITGGPGPAENPFAPTGVLAASAEAVSEQAIRAASDAWATVDADAEDVAVPIPPNAMPATLGAGACALDAAVHAWDIAVATGQPSRFRRSSPSCCRPSSSSSRPCGALGTLMRWRHSTATTTWALLRYLGRRPDWTA